MDEVSVTVSIDTEEDDWGSFAESGASSVNIGCLPALQEVFDRHGARATYFVNLTPLMSSASVAVLGALGERSDVEIGAHCHPWNTPPSTGAGPERSMMCALPEEANRAKIAEVTRRLTSELGVRPRSFRAGRWGFGPTVSRALASEGYFIDASVSPFVDWSDEGGPDFSTALDRPYRFRPERPLDPDPTGSMVEIPTTVGFLRGDQQRGGAIRRLIQREGLRQLKLVALFETLGLLRRRWLSPELSSPDDVMRLAVARLSSGTRHLDFAFHSCTLLPGATPFVSDDRDRTRFFETIDRFLGFCVESGLRFRTFSEVGDATPGARAGQPA